MKVKFIFTFLFLISFSLFSQEKNQIIYIANEGVFIENEGKKILIDALHKKSSSLYQETKFPYPDMLLNGDEPFDMVDLFLITHVHDDHFNKEYMSEYLEKHQETILIAPQQVLDTLGNVPYLAAQIYPVKGKDNGLMYEMDGIKITTIPLLHSYQKKNAWVENMAYLIDIEGVTVLHVGDAELIEENFQAIQKAIKGKVDYAIFPYWLYYDDGLNWVNKKIKAKKFIAVHVPTTKSGTFEGILKKKVNNQNLNVFLTVGETQVIKGGGE